jgi:hypothetical protein
MNPDPPDAGAPHTVLFATVRQRLNQVPFKPFRIVTTSGRAYDVPTADHAGVVPLLRTIQIARDDGSAIDLHALHVSAIEPLPKRRRRAA